MKRIGYLIALGATIFSTGCVYHHQHPRGGAYYYGRDSGHYRWHDGRGHHRYYHNYHRDWHDGHRH